MRSLGRRITLNTYRTTRFIVRTLAGAMVLLVLVFLFLRLYGVPKPLLEKVVRRANTSGIPVDVGRISLTLRGWRASDVRYYSRHPDDLKPVFEAGTVYFSRQATSGSKGYGLVVEALDVAMNPSVEWGIDLPEANPARRIERVVGDFSFQRDRIVITRGKMFWLGVDIGIDGTILKPSEKARKAKTAEPRAKRLDKVLPRFVSRQQILMLEDRLKTLHLDEVPKMKIHFLVDGGDYSASRVDFSLEAGQLAYQEALFSRAEISGTYAFPLLRLDPVALEFEGRSIRLSGMYDFETEQVEGRLENGILSNRLLRLLPPCILDIQESLDVSFGELPRIDMAFGPSPLSNVLGRISGSFEINDVVYRGLGIDAVRGQIGRIGERLELRKVRGRLRGQPECSAETGSAMRGGTVEGSAFWDASRHVFEIQAMGQCDPNLMLEPLSMVEIATNIIDRFKFGDEPPSVELKLGADYRDWRTFFIDISGAAADARFHGVSFSTINASAHYTNGVLCLEPVVVTQGADFLKGSVALDFDNSIARFDVLDRIAPEVLEDVLYPQLNLFGKWIKTSGKTSIDAHGIFDWGAMAAMNFSAEVAAERLVFPLAELNDFTATVSGKDAALRVDPMACELYGGRGSGHLAIQLGPQLPSMPYEARVEFGGIDFNAWLQYMQPDARTVSGTLSGKTEFNADFETDFFTSANGTGSVSVTEGQLADLPLFRGFSRVLRKVIPGFNVFSITSLRGTFQLKNGTLYSDDAYFEGDVLSAKGRGHYSVGQGFDAYIHAQVMSENPISRVVRAITDPIFKFFEVKLEGPLSDPRWRVEKFPEEAAKWFRSKAP